MDAEMSGKSSVRCLSRMLEESIHADVTIHTSGGAQLRAHRAVLSASSPVFHSMFTHELAEKESSSVTIDDMCAESCAALLAYLYGTIRQEEFWEHRVALLGAADKYDIADLKDACEASLAQDINSANVLRRLHEAWVYRLPALKKGCLVYLFEFGKIYDIRDEINDFVLRADRDLIAEMFQEVLTVWKPV